MSLPFWHKGLQVIHITLTHRVGITDWCSQAGVHKVLSLDRHRSLTRLLKQERVRVQAHRTADPPIRSELFRPKVLLGVHLGALMNATLIGAVVQSPQYASTEPVHSTAGNRPKIARRIFCATITVGIGVHTCVVKVVP